MMVQELVVMFAGGTKISNILEDAQKCIFYNTLEFFFNPNAVLMYECIIKILIL